jgi:hypothetical protein
MVVEDAIPVPALQEGVPHQRLVVEEVRLVAVVAVGGRSPGWRRWGRYKQTRGILVFKNVVYTF